MSEEISSRIQCPRIWSVQWFVSRTVRQATQMCKHVRKLVNAQRDLLGPKQIGEIAEAIESLRQGIAARVGQKALMDGMQKLEATANKWLKTYPNPGLRENVEVLLVALAVAMGIRTFFLQPFKIPTGSMQPTLFGITEENLLERPDFKIPNVVSRFFQYWLSGISYVHLEAKADGQLVDAKDPTRFLLFNLKQRIQIGREWYTIWFPPDNLLGRAGLADRQAGHVTQKYFRKGDDIIKLKVVSGDHLFVDRFTYNFRPPKRGEIIVFQTGGINHRDVPNDQYYIKRLVGLPGETVSIDSANHLVIDGRHLDASEPGFENLYGYWPDQRYRGHVHAGMFGDETQKYPIKPKSFLAMGDNTRNSLDSRYWGDFPQKYVIGKSYFVYWPISDRFGWGHR